MKEKAIKNEGQGRIFKSPILEYMTKAPAPISGSIYVSVILWMLYVAYSGIVIQTALEAITWYFGAMFFWTFFEYFFHRYINHLDAYFPESKWAHSVAHTLHGVHHEYPRDKERLMMPPIPGLIIVAILYFSFGMILGDFVYIFMPGFMTGYLFYASVHIAVHQRKVPALFKKQYRHHALHHYKYPDKAFGVSTTLWDRVFGTMPPQEQ